MSKRTKGEVAAVFVRCITARTAVAIKYLEPSVTAAQTSKISSSNSMGVPVAAGVKLTSRNDDGGVAAAVTDATDKADADEADVVGGAVGTGDRGGMVMGGGRDLCMMGRTTGAAACVGR